MRTPGTPIAVTAFEPTDENVNGMFSIWWIGFLSGTASTGASCLREVGRSDEEILRYGEVALRQMEANKNKFFCVRRQRDDGEWDVVLVAPELDVIGPVSP